MSLAFFPATDSAATDYSTYKLETGHFSTEDQAKDAVAKLKTQTGYTGQYKQIYDYQIVSGYYNGESKAKSVLQQFQTATGMKAIYEGWGDPLDYYRINSGYYNSEAKAKSVLQQLKSATGVNGSYDKWMNPDGNYQVKSGYYNSEPKAQEILQQFQTATGLTGHTEGWGDPENYYQLKSGYYNSMSSAKSVLQQFTSATKINGNVEGYGDSENYYQLKSGYYSESAAKSMLQQFTTATGIKGKVEGYGDPEKYYQITSGYYNSETTVKQVLQQFKNATGISANYIKLANNQFQLKSDPIQGMPAVNSGLAYFKDLKLNAEYQATGKTVYTKFQITADPVLGKTALNIGQSFFNKKNLKVEYQTTGEKSYSKFQIVSDPLLGLNAGNAGLSYFKQKNLHAEYQATGKTGFTRFQVVSDPVVGRNIDSGLSFFTKQKLAVISQATDPLDDEKYEINTDPVLGMTQVNQVSGYFTANNLKSTYQTTGDQGFDKFQIRTTPVAGEDQLNKGLQYFQSKSLSASNTTVGEPYYQLVTNEFTGNANAKAGADKITRLLGWDVYIADSNKYTDYGMSLSQMLNLEMNRSPQTDQYRNEPRYIYADYVDIAKQKVKGDKVNVRTGPSDTSPIAQQVNNGTSVMVIKKTGDWVEVRMTWQNAKSADVQYYLDPNNFASNTQAYFQFIQLSKPAYADVNEVNNKILANKGILAGKAQAFITAAQTYNVNELYLISHALLETGNGTSSLAKGVVYNGKTVYNVYGYGAFDSCPVTCGAQTAYDNGWFSPELAIIGGAKLISGGYIYNTTFQQDTIYKMRWNPVQISHQYATDIGWAYKQVSSIFNLYQLLNQYTLYYDIPVYR